VVAERHASLAARTPSVNAISPPRRILLVSLDNVGDLVFASALTPPLREAFPEATIDLWCKKYTADVGALVPHVRDVVAADPFWAVPAHMERPPVTPFLRSIAEVRRRRYDVAVLSEAPWRAATAVAMTGIPARIGLARHRNQAFLTHVLPRADENKSVLGEQARLLTALGIQSAERRYRLDTAKLEPARGEMARLLPPRFVALHPFAGARDRCVSLGEWAQVAFALAARGMPVLWFGLPSELSELRASVTHPPGFYGDVIAKDSFTMGAAALSLASVFAGHDSGPLHVAGAFGLPVVGVFAPGQPARTFPQGVGPSRMIHHASPAGITAAMILREIDALTSTA
jgi:ADP-heptose:LPS heptosyltransferase